LGEDQGEGLQVIVREIHETSAFELRAPGTTRGKLFRSVGDAINGALDAAEPEEKDEGMPSIKILIMKKGKIAEERIIYGDEEVEK
jgi:hypothetical protein